MHVSEFSIADGEIGRKKATRVTIAVKGSLFFILYKRRTDWILALDGTHVAAGKNAIVRFQRYFHMTIELATNEIVVLSSNKQRCLTSCIHNNRFLSYFAYNWRENLIKTGIAVARIAVRPFISCNSKLKYTRLATSHTSYCCYFDTTVLFTFYRRARATYFLYSREHLFTHSRSFKR